MNLIKHYPLTAISVLIIIILSVMPLPDEPPLGDVPFIDKWVHFVMYGGMACAVWIDYYRKAKDKRITLSVIFISIIYPIVLGGLLELVQAYLTTYRSGDIIDFYADAVGGIIGFVVGILILRPMSWVLFHKDKKD